MSKIKEITATELYAALEVANKRLGKDDVQIINNRYGSGEVSLRLFIDSGKRIYTPSDAVALAQKLIKAANEAAAFPYNGCKVVKQKITREENDEH